MTIAVRAKTILNLFLKMDSRRWFCKTVKTGQKYSDTVHSDSTDASNL